MILFFSLFLLLQDAEHDPSHEHSEAQENRKFTPVVSGNVLEAGSFIYDVPDGVFFTGREHARDMFSLAKAEFVPNCEGLFFSGSGTWEYCVVVQHFPFQAVELEPVLPPETLTGVFTRQHLLNLTPFSGQAEVVVPPAYDTAAGSFSMGMRYDHGHHYPIIIKKLWVTQKDALVLTVLAKDGAYVSDRDQIEAILAGPHVNPDVDLPNEPVGKPISYLRLLGVKAGKNDPSPQVAGKNDPSPQVDPGVALPKSVTYTSGLLLVLGLVLFSLVLVVQRKQKAKGDAGSSE